MRNDLVKVNVKVPGGLSYPIVIGSGLLNKAGKWAQRALDREAARIVIVSNQKVFELYGQQVEESLASAGFIVSIFLIKDGETHKNLRTAEHALTFFTASRLSRTDAVIALGGGVVGDVAGFAAAIYLRGVPLLQIPTTLLSMIDSSVGGKTGVNSKQGKNLIGAFHQPRGVLIDVSTLGTLPRRELTAGFCEAVKQGAISGRVLLGQTSEFLKAYPPNVYARAGLGAVQDQVADLIAAQVSFKAKIVAGDEREISGRVDARSRKILNFGHTLAHALEMITEYKYFKHGEAVGYGIMFAAELSKSLALCSENDVNLLNDVVHLVGTLPSLAKIDGKGVLEAFKFDKKNVSGLLQMVLLKGLGKPIIVTEKDIPRATAEKVLRELLEKWA